MEKTKKPFMTEERKSRILFSVLLAIGVPLLVFIAVPFEIWYNNIEELNYYFSDIFGYLFIMFLVAAVAIFAVLFVVPKTLYKVLRGLALGGGLMIFLQANYLNVGLSGLAGDEGISVVAKVGTTAVIINALVWVLVIGGCTAASILVKKEDISRMVSIVLALIICFTQVMNILVGVISTDFDKADISAQLKREDPNYQLSFLTNKNLTTVAEDRNVVVFVVDRFDAVRYCDPNIDLIKEYVDDFGGFTYFSDNISMYGRTYPSVAYMLTKKEILLNEKRKDYFKRAYQENNTLAELDRQGYSINIYTDSYYGYYDAYHFPGYVDNVERVPEGRVYREVKWKRSLYMSSVKLSLYKSFPIILKDMVGGISTTSINSCVSYEIDELANPIYTTSMEKTQQDFAENEFEVLCQKNFSLIHLDGLHGVYYTPGLTGGKDLHTAFTETFSIIKRYIDEMKRLGVYENSTIIITGDHACAMSDTTSLDGIRATALFVKPSNQTGTVMQISTAQVSHDNLWATIFKSEGIAFDESVFGKSVFDINPLENQRRQYIWHKVNASNKTYNQMIYAIYGNGRDFDNWMLLSDIQGNKPLHD